MQVMKDVCQSIYDVSLYGPAFNENRKPNLEAVVDL